VRLVTALALLAAPASATIAADDTLAGAVDALVAPFKGTVSIYAKNLDTGREFARSPDRQVRTASTIKLPILCALEAEVAAGRVAWTERLPVRDTDKVYGSGILKELSAGTELTVRDLATLMIIVSDNTATNLILDRITADLVNGFLDTLGLKQTRALRKVRGSTPPPDAQAGWSKAGLLEENKRFGLGVSTPREMVRLLELLAEGKVVSPEASAQVIDIMKRQQVKDGIGRRARGFDVASKSGALDALRSDIGIAYTKGGRIAMAITVDDMPEVDYSPDNAGDELIWAISQVLLDGLR
jgi:beta-lactamase class A